MDFSRYGEVVRVTGSLRSHLNLPVYHGTDPDVDEWIRENRIERVIVLLIDAMGTSILKRHLTENSFFLSFSHAKVCQYSFSTYYLCSYNSNPDREDAC